MADIKKAAKIIGDISVAAASFAAANGGIELKLGAKEKKIAKLLKQNKLKAYGRYTVKDGRMSGFWGGNGFEMNISLKNDDIIKLTAFTNDIVYLAVYIDGEYQTRTNAITKDMPEIYIPVSGGEHTVKILRDTQINTDGSKFFYFDTFTFSGKVLKRPKDKELFIEIIGDSIACGDGALGSYKEGEGWKAPEDHSAVAGFAYKLAQKMDADYSITARGGIGLYDNSSASQEKTAVKRVTMQEIYDYTNGYADMGSKENRFDFKRKPDLIIFELSGNDNTLDEDCWGKKAVDFLNHVRENYGEDIPIVWSGRNPVHYETLCDIIDQKKLSNFYACRFAYGGSGSAALKTQKSGHPSANEQTEIADNLFNFISQNGVLAKKEAPEVIVSDNAENKKKNTAKKVGIIGAAAAVTGAAAAVTFALLKKRNKK